MVLVCAVPNLAGRVSMWIGYTQSGFSGYALLARTLRSIVGWGTVPLAGCLFVRLALHLSKAGIWLQRTYSIKSRWCLAFALSFACLLPMSVMWALPQFAAGLTEKDDLLPVAFFLPFLCVACDPWSYIHRLGFFVFGCAQLIADQKT